MKTALIIAILTLLIANASCTKKQDNVHSPVNDSPSFTETEDSGPAESVTEASPTEPTVTEQARSEITNVPAEPIVVDFSNRKPFKYTVNADLKAKEFCNFAYVDDNGEQVYSCEQPEDPDVIKVLVVVQNVDGKYPILYDLDCESDGTYEYIGLTTPHAFCTYKNHSGKHQISVRGDIPGMILCTRKGDIQAMDNHFETDDFISIISERNDIPQYVNDDGVDNVRILLSDYFYSEPVSSIDDWGDIEWKSMALFASDCEMLKNIPENPPNLKDVTDMRGMFRNAKKFNQPLNKWDVSSVTDMSSMFEGAKSFNQSLGNWDVSNVTNMRKMYAHAESFNQPLNEWNVSKVTDMLGMFWGAKSFNQPLDKWDVSIVTDMSGMFAEAKSFKKSLKAWGESNNTDFSNRKPFKYTITTNVEPKQDSSEEYDEKPKKKLPNKVKVLVAVNDVDGNYPVKYDLDCDSDGKYEFTGLTESKYCTYKRNSGNHQISVRGDIPGMILCERKSYDNDWNDEDNDYRRNVPERGDVEREYMDRFWDEGEPVIAIDDWGDIQWRSMFAFASNCKNLQRIPENAPNLNNVKDMRYMFSNSHINQPLGNWDVSHVTNMAWMFADSQFNQPLENWDVSHVTNMAYMFYESGFNQPLEKWDVSHVTDMRHMFYESGFNQPLEKWDVSHVEHMSGMFQVAKMFNQPLDKWDISNVKNMEYMFLGASSFSYYPKNWVVPAGTSITGNWGIFGGTKVQETAKQHPLKTHIIPPSKPSIVVADKPTRDTSATTEPGNTRLNGSSAESSSEN